MIPLNGLQVIVNRIGQRRAVIGLAFVLGAVLGWWLLGWTLFPLDSEVDPIGLNAGAKNDLVAMTVESWSLTHDLKVAQARLQGLRPEELSSALKRLVVSRQQTGEQVEVSRFAEFGRAFGLTIEIAAEGPTLPAPSPRAAQPTPTMTVTPVISRISIAADVTGTIRAALVDWAKNNDGLIIQDDASADIVFGTQGSDPSALFAERVYVVVDRFATLRTGISLNDLKRLWSGKVTNDGARILLASEETVSALASVLGAPAPNVETYPDDSITTQLWAEENSLAIIPFDQLNVKVRALPIDNLNILSRSLSLDQYPLVTRVYFSGRALADQGLVNALHQKIPLTNRDSERITTVIMTGTTAVTRTSAWEIEQKHDPAYPARVVGPVLAAADITHVSNEIPYIDNCQPVLHTMSFCAKASYMAAFKLAGVSIVGLTGNHLLDFGAQPFLHTLDLYDAAGLRYYGGGRNAAEAAKTLFLQDHGNKLAFIGTNSFGPVGDWATATGPGANRYTYSTLKAEIADARRQADIVFDEHQGEETYDYAPSANNRLEFHVGLDAGADVVTGVQAHHPQAIEFSADGRRIILYGLGNLFFDQMFDEGVRQEIIARHTIYGGRLIQTELLTAMLEDYVQPRWATAAEHAKILTAVFAASGWGLK